MNPLHKICILAFVVASVFLAGCATEFNRHLKSAQKGNALDQYKLGIMYLTGTNGVFEGDQVVTRDLRAAKDWFEKASMQGADDMQNHDEMTRKSIGEAQLALGLCYYYNGKIDKDMPEGKDLGIVRDVANYATAFNYFNEALSNGVEEARLWLGECYMLGRGTRQNTTEAIKCFKEGKKGMTVVGPACSKKLGDCHLYGIGFGTARNKASCLEYYSAAKKGGNKRAEKILEKKEIDLKFEGFNLPPYPVADPEKGYRYICRPKMDGDSYVVEYSVAKGADMREVEKLITAEIKSDSKAEFFDNPNRKFPEYFDTHVREVTNPDKGSGNKWYQATRLYPKIKNDECEVPARGAGYKGVFVCLLPNFIAEANCIEVVRKLQQEYTGEILKTNFSENNKVTYGKPKKEPVGDYLKWTSYFEVD